MSCLAGCVQIETQGRVGKARWRLVSAPSIPGLLSLDPTLDPTNLLSSLTMGTEVEVQFGKSLQVRQRSTISLPFDSFSTY